MATSKVWNGKVKRQMFEWLPNIEVNGKLVGFYTQKWTSKPPHLSAKEWKIACQMLLDKLIKAKLFIKEPKSAGAVDSIIQHCIAPQNNPGFRKLRSSLRFAAYYAGFMEMTDIVYLEDKARAKHGIRVDQQGDE